MHGVPSEGERLVDTCFFESAASAALFFLPGLRFASRQWSDEETPKFFRSADEIRDARRSSL